jgi:hypothetical protein
MPQEWWEPVYDEMRSRAGRGRGSGGGWAPCAGEGTPAATVDAFLEAAKRYVSDDIRRRVRACRVVAALRRKDVRLTVMAPGGARAEKATVGRLCRAAAFFGDWFAEIRNRPGSRSLPITVCLTDARKEVTTDPHPPALTGDRINSGVTFLDVAGRVVHVLVFRREECVKVLIHELIHAYGRDFPSPGNSHGPMLSETFTEAAATLLHACFVARTRDEARRLIAAEQAHARCVADRVARLAGYPDHIACARDNGVDGPVKFVQTTHAYEYYVLRAVLLNAGAPTLRAFAARAAAAGGWTHDGFRDLLRRAIAGVRRPREDACQPSGSLAMTATRA